MARIAGVDIPRDKRVVIALTYIYGVGPTRAQQTLEATDVDADTRVRDLSEDQVQRLRVHIEENYRVE
ncbi:MAG: 30S ribosomal protein S13, partial [Actinomycetes bacterium]